MAFAGARKSQWLLALIYVVLAMPYVYRSLDAGLGALDLKTLVEAARSLGSGWVSIIWRVLIPNLRSALLSASVLTLALVFGEFTIASLDGWTTIPVWIYLTPTTNPRINTLVAMMALLGTCRGAHGDRLVRPLEVSKLQEELMLMDTQTPARRRRRGAASPGRRWCSRTSRGGSAPRRRSTASRCDIEPGEFVALLGPSGCGKTTALRVLAGFERPDIGKVVVDGQDVVHVPAQKRDMGMVFQSYSLFPNMSARDNVAFGLQLRHQRGASRRARADELLELVGLAEHTTKYPHQLSGGQQQRVALARALAIEPRVLLLDEPLSALDAKVRAELRDQIRALQQRLMITTVFVTHDQEEALSMADRGLRDVARARRTDRDTGRALLEALDRVRRAVRRHLQSGRVVRSGDSVALFGRDVKIRGEVPTGAGSLDALLRPEDVDVVVAPTGLGIITHKSFLGATTRLEVGIGGSDGEGRRLEQRRRRLRTGYARRPRRERPRRPRYRVSASDLTSGSQSRSAPTSRPSTLPVSSQVRRASASSKPGCVRSAGTPLRSRVRLGRSTSLARRARVGRGTRALACSASASRSRAAPPVARPTLRRGERGCARRGLRDRRRRREVETRIALHVDGQVADVVEERRDDQRVRRAAVARERGALQRVFDLRDRLAVGLIAARFVEVEEFVDGRGRNHSLSV